MQKVLHALTIAAVAMLPGCWKLEPKVPGGGQTESARKAQQTAARDRRIRQACASEATYGRLKELAFDEARRVRGVANANFEQLMAASVIRMEQPLVKSRDETLNVTVCTGRLILELPPGAEGAFGGERRLVANIEYAAQAAADGSGLIYQMDGAEPIVYRLAAFDARRIVRPPGPSVPEFGNPDQQETVQADTPVASPPAAPPTRSVIVPEPPSAPRAPRRVVERDPLPPPRRVVVPAPPPPVVEDAPARPQQASARPSFNCRYARSRVEIMICNDDRLAAADRRMASLFYAELAAAGPESRRELQRTRNAFVRARDGCRSEACVADSYAERIAELRDWDN